MTNVLLRNAALALLWGAAAAAGCAQDATPPAVTLAGLQIAPGEAPAGYKLAPGPDGISRTLLDFLARPDQDGLLLAPVATATQVLVSPAGKNGGIVCLEYAKPFPDPSRTVLPGVLWGEDKRATPAHPEEIVVIGKFLVLLSFEYQSDDAEWYKDLLRRRLKARIPRAWKTLRPVLDRVAEADRARDPDTGLALLREQTDRIGTCSYAQFLLGRLSGIKRDWPAADAAFRRALELDRLEDPLPGGAEMLWAAHDGLGLALAVQAKMADAVAPLEEADRLARDLGNEDFQTKTEYNLACVYAELERFADAYHTLKRCVETRPAMKADARKDSSFKKALEREEFRTLLE